MVVPGSAEDGWPRYAGYGTVTLVARSAPLTGSLCVHFGESRMWRNALVTDVVLGGAEPHAYILRVANTHLESLPEGTPRRVVQMRVIAGLLKDAKVLDGIVCGDMNAIAPSDETIAEANGLLDAWEQRQNRDEDSTTWGYQPRCRFPPGRLDRILHTPSKGVRIKDVRRLAVGLEMPSGGWVSDHYGLACQGGGPTYGIAGSRRWEGMSLVATVCRRTLALRGNSCSAGQPESGTQHPRQGIITSKAEGDGR
ncbi:Endonuclease/exonuclease/phosphatase [Lactarius pseudohatsudake]|nr:Endonuclease/exonuclease/phosphatase [Lactarius pseudohatsudake]